METNEHIFRVPFGLASIDPKDPEHCQISFSHQGAGYIFVLSRREFELLGRAIAERLKAIPLRQPKHDAPPTSPENN